jgi:hypothetical protein
MNDLEVDGLQAGSPFFHSGIRACVRRRPPDRDNPASSAPEQVQFGDCRLRIPARLRPAPAARVVGISAHLGMTGWRHAPHLDAKAFSIRKVLARKVFARIVPIFEANIFRAKTRRAYALLP